MIKEKIHRTVITDADLKNAVSLIPNKDFMNTAGLNEYEKNQILDIANNNCLVSYINTVGKRFEQCVSIGCDPFH